MQLTGFHHVTAISADAPGNHRFYTGALGMRLVKRTVNQDATSAYHLFYADGEASPGSDLTFFDFPTGPERRGTRSVTRTALRVGGEASLRWWAERLDAHGVARGGIGLDDGRLSLRFEDPEGQRISLVDDGGAIPFHPWARSPVPAEYQIRGLGPVTMRVPDPGPTGAVLTELLGMHRTRSYPDPETGAETAVYVMGAGGPTAELRVAAEPGLAPAPQGAGGVHHVAFRTPDERQLAAWTDRLRSRGVRASGPIDRFYFRSLYFREPGGILFEIATDGPGFAVDEPAETLGESLSLPPFLEERRREIEAGLRPI